MNQRISLLLIFCCLIACDNDEVVQTRLRVNHYQQPVTSLTDYFAILTQEQNQFASDEWTYHDPNIEGFEYEWGYAYELLVTQEKLKNPPQDASSIKTTLVQIVSKEKLPQDTPFEIRLTMTYDDGGFNNYIRGDASSGYSLLGSVAVDCGTLCDELSEVLNAKERVTGVFNHQGDGIKLIELKKY